MLMIPIEGYSQVNVQWKASVNVGWEGNTNPRADWLFDVITTSDGNYLAVGFGREDETGNDEHEDTPAYCLMGGNGRFIRDGILPGDDNPGRLYSVVEADNDSYYAVGDYEFNNNRTGLLVKINKTTLDAEYIPVSPTTANTGSRINNIKNIIYGPNNTLHHLLIVGSARGADKDQRWIAICDYDGNIIKDFPFPLSGGTLEETTQAIDYEVKANGDLTLYTASTDGIQDDSESNPQSYRHHDKDILINIINYDVSLQTFSSSSSTALNSITKLPRDISDNAKVFDGDIFFDYPPNNFFDKYPYGPKYLSSPSQANHVTFGRNLDPSGNLFENWNENISINGYYIEDWSNGSEDSPYSLIVTDQYIVVSALLNKLILWKNSNEVLGNDIDSNAGLDTDGSNNSCVDYDGSYLWGEAYVLFLKKDNLSLVKATHLGTWSGGDFNPKMIQTADGGFAIAGSIAGCPQNLPAVGHGEDGILVKLDANGNVKYRKTSTGPNDVDFCAFSLTESPDGGIVMVGNTDDEGGIEHEENYCFVKFGLGCGYDDASITSTTNNKYIVGVDETWSTDQTVKTQVVIPAGHKLTITGGGPSDITTIQFADSREVYDLDNNTGIGIKVEVGGRLNIVYAKLTGWSCNGQSKMWDGISVEGMENKEQTPEFQGICHLFVSVIEDARIGVAASSVWWTPQVINAENTYGPTGSNSNIEAPSFRHGNNGGGKIDALLTDFVNNRRSAIFMKYLPLNQSRFRYCNFISDGPLADLTWRQKPPGLLDFHTLPVGTFMHLSVWATNVDVRSCNFTGSSAIIPDFRPMGIAGANASLLVSNGNMNTLKVGIEGAGTTGGLTANLSARGIIFDNVVQGINLRGSAADKVLGCTFDNIPFETTLSGIEPTGIFAVFTAATLIENNQFTGTDATQETFGLVVRETGKQGVEIKENEFNDTRYGNQFEGDNLALSATCNQYTDMGFAAWNCLTLAGQGILGDQGDINPLGNKADNQFFDDCIPTAGDKHIYSTFTFNYYDKTGNPNPADVNCVSDVVNFQTSSLQTPLACQIPETPCSHPCDYISIFLQTDKNINARNKALRGLIHTGVDANDEKLPILYDDAMFILKDRGLEEDQKLLIGTLTGLEKISEAQTEILTFPTNNTENLAYLAYVNGITSAGLNATGLNIFATNNNTSGGIFLNVNTPTLAMANNVQWLTGGAYTPLIALTDANGGGGRNPIFDTGETAVANTVALKVYPNPFSNVITFDLQTLDDEVIYQIEVVDILGKSIWKKEANGGISIDWPSSELSTGAYFYSIRTDKTTVSSGKIVKLDK